MPYAWEDLDEFFDTDDFSDEVIFTLSNGTVLDPIVGMLEEDFAVEDIGIIDIESTQPRFLCKTADVSDVGRGDTVVINSITYDVLGSPQDDGTGLCVVLLARADV